MNQASMDALKAQLRRHEGVVRHAYQDHLGYWTIGVGRLIDERRGGGLSDIEINYLLDNDILRVSRALKERLPFWDRLRQRQQMGLINMGFQLGVNGLLNFKRMLAALERGDTRGAYKEALDSRWAQQTPARAKEVASMLGDPV